MFSFLYGIFIDFIYAADAPLLILSRRLDTSPFSLFAMPPFQQIKRMNFFQEDFAITTPKLLARLFRRLPI